jgi:hypothetical protein
VTLKPLRGAGAGLTAIGAAGLAGYILGPSNVFDIVPRYAPEGWLALLGVGCVLWLVSYIRPRAKRVEVAVCRSCHSPVPSITRLEREGWTRATGGGFLCPACQSEEH